MANLYNKYNQNQLIHHKQEQQKNTETVVERTFTTALACKVVQTKIIQQNKKSILGYRAEKGKQ